MSCVGRHSAPDDEPDAVVDADTLPTPVLDAPATGRHAPPEPSAPSAPSAPSESHGAADLRLLREQPALRARCAAGAVVPFVLYSALMIVIGKVSLYLLWVWIPIVLAGILVGTFLDLAHRRDRVRDAPSRPSPA
jgi:hypothetical protein